MTIDPSKTYTATMVTSCGQIVLQLDAVHAPIGVNSFVFLAKKGFYDGLTFHRIVSGFVIQGGDPKGDGSGGPGYQFATETSPKVTFDSAGLLAYANSGADTNGSQFFITLAPTPQLDPSASQSFTIFGKVIKGLDVVQKIGAIPGTPNPGIQGENSVPTQTVYIESVTISVGS
jgi:cyclophilin family peptidyl-prolyl cis-trans isomerase